MSWLAIILIIAIHVSLPIWILLISFGIYNLMNNYKNLDQALVRVMFIDICSNCVVFPDKQDTDIFRKQIYDVYQDYNFDDKTIKRATSIWKKRRLDIRGLKAAEALLFLYHFILLAEMDIIQDGYLNKYFEDLSQHIPDKYFPTNEKQTDSVAWLKCKGEARKMLNKLRKVNEVFL